MKPELVCYFCSAPDKKEADKTLQWLVENTWASRSAFPRQPESSKDGQQAIAVPYLGGLHHCCFRVASSGLFDGLIIGGPAFPSERRRATCVLLSVWRRIDDVGHALHHLGNCPTSGCHVSVCRPGRGLQVDSLDMGRLTAYNPKSV